MRKTFIHKHITICIIGFVISGCLFNSFSMFRTSNVATAQPPGGSSLAHKSPLLSQAEASKITIGQLVDKLGSSNASERTDAAMTIVALRDHYILGTEQVTVNNLQNKADGSIVSSGLNTLAFLRSSSPKLMGVADKNITFTWFPQITALPVGGEAQPMPRLLIRASLPALESLQNYFENDMNVNVDTNQMSPQQKLRLQVAVSILGPSAPLWFDKLAVKQSNLASKKRLMFYAHIVSDSYATAQKAHPDLPMPLNLVSILRGFLNANALDEQLDPSDLDQIDISKYIIDWNAPDKLSLATQEGTDRPVPPWPNERTAETIIASHDMERTIALLEYNICLRLNTDTNIKSIQSFVPYSSDAQIDAVRVLGTLRLTSLAAYVIWQRLRRASIKMHIDDSLSLDTQVSLAALGKIDVPATRMLVTRIAAELSPEQQRAATYALGKVMGVYAIPYINQAISITQQSMVEETDQGYKSQYQNELGNLKNMLELGKEKGWFTGDYYGTHDPHAYDLVFDDTPAPAKAPQP